MAKAIHPDVRIGHVHLKVADLERAFVFYRDVFGFELTQRYGDEAAFLSAGGYHHHIGLNTWDSAGGKPPPSGSTGLYHLPIRNAVSIIERRTCIPNQLSDRENIFRLPQETSELEEKRNEQTNYHSWHRGQSSTRIL